MTVHTSSGSSIYIGTTVGDNSNDQTDYEGDSYVLIGEVVNIGEFGRTYAPITHSSLENRNVQKFKGQRDDGTIALIIGSDSSNSGQAAMLTALDDDRSYNFKIIENDDITSPATGTTTYCRAQVMSWRKTIGDATNVVQRRADLNIQSGTLLEIAAH